MFRLVILSSFFAMSLALVLSYSFLVKHEDNIDDHKRNKRQTTCKAGYSYNAPTGYCYKYVSAAANFSNAVAACRSDGGDLISILSVGENNMLDQMALAIGGLQKVWIGFFLNTSYVWQWSDSSSVSYTNWYQNYPGAKNMASCPATRAPWSTPNKACVDFQPTGFPCNGGGNFWENSYDCSQLLPYVCKQRAQCSILGGPCRIDSNCDGQHCTMDFDCCSGHCSTAQICQCTLNGGTCQTGVACCGGQACNTATNTC